MMTLKLDEKDQHAYYYTLAYALAMCCYESEETLLHGATAAMIRNICIWAYHDCRIGKITDQQAEVLLDELVELNILRSEKRDGVWHYKFSRDSLRDLLKDAHSVCVWLTDDEIQKAVHIAQLRGVLPLIEEQRLAFIDRLGSRLDRILPFTDDYGSYFAKPQEVELRHLIHYYYNKKELWLSPGELELLNKPYDARNNLSHLRILTEDVIIELADLSGR